PYRPQQQGRRNRRIDASGKSADYSVRADPFPQLSLSLREKRLHRPLAVAPANLIKEVAEHEAALRRMANFGMEQEAVHRLVAMAHGGNRAGFRGSQGQEIGTDGLDLISVTHPNDGVVGNPGEEPIGLANVTVSPAKLATRSGFDLCAEYLAS